MKYRFAATCCFAAFSTAWFSVPCHASGGGESAFFSAERYIEHDKFLSSDALEGRRPGTPGIEQAATYIAYHFMTYGLKPAGVNDTYYQPFEVRSGKKINRGDASLSFDGLDGDWVFSKDWITMPFSGVGGADGPLAFAGYGIEYTPEPPDSQPADSQPAKPEQPYNDYQNFDATGKVLIIFRHEPRAGDPGAKFGGKEPSTKSLFVNKANLAADKGAKALIVVNPPERDSDNDGKPDADDLYAWSDYERATYRLPIIQVSQAVAEKLLAKAGLPDLRTLQSKLEKDRKPLSADLKDVKVSLQTGLRYIEARNVIGLLEGAERPDEYIVVGAHYDHLGKVPVMFGDDRTPQIHNGADDNASGSSGVLELARVIASGPRPKRSILFMTFSAEEMGLLGSAHYVKKPTVELSKIKAMINLDMIGRMGQKELEIYGVPTAVEFPELVAKLASEYGIEYKATGNNDRYFGASDHASFFYKGIPVLFAFTGTHPQYHKPDDDWERIDAEGAATLLKMFHRVVTTVADMESGPTKPSTEKKAKEAEKPKNAAEAADEAARKAAQELNDATKKSTENLKKTVEETKKAADATIKETQKAADEKAKETRDAAKPAPDAPAPDDANRPRNAMRVRMRIEIDYSDNGSGVLVKRVLPGGPAEKAGVKDGDRIIKVGAKDVNDVESYMTVMKDVKPGDEIEVTLKRGDKSEKLKIKFDADSRPPGPR